MFYAGMIFLWLMDVPIVSCFFLLGGSWLLKSS